MSRHFTFRPFEHISRYFVLLMIFIAVLSGCISQMRRPTSTNTPQEMFEALFDQPLPDNVQDLQGVGDTEQGYTIFMRFQTGLTFLAPFLKEGYEKIDCDDVLPHLKLPAGYDRFTPSWEPESIDLPICYQSVDPVSNSWTQNGQHYFLIDARTALVYFYGTGD